MASADTIKPSEEPDLLTVARDITEPATAGAIQTPMHLVGHIDGPGGQLPLLGRLGQISDIVHGVLFLESSSYITGEILHIDGGQIAGHFGSLG